MANSSFAHRDLKDFRQFPRDQQNPKSSWSNGWGFDVKTHHNEYRIVIFSPERFDEVHVKLRHDSKKDKHKKPAKPPVDNAVDDVRLFKDELGIRHAQVATRGGRYEHGPAHVHVFDKRNHRESRLELVEYPDNNSNAPHAVNWLEGTNPAHHYLSSRQKEEILPVLEDHIPEFLQLWREFFEKTYLATEITRVSEVFPNHVARIQRDCDPRAPEHTKKDKFTVKLKSLDNEGNEKSIPLHEYVKLPPAPKTNGRN